MQKLIDLNDGKLLERGIFPSLGANQQELWRVANNVEFKSQRAKKAVGYTIDTPTNGTVRAIAQAYVDSQRRAYWAEADRIYSYNVGNDPPLKIGSGFSGAAGFWSLETWGTWLLASNQEDPPKIWKNIESENSMVDLGGLTGIRAGRKYRILKKHKNHMLGYFGQRVDWSHESDVELWVPDTNNSAGGFDIRDLDSDIVAVCQLGPDMAIYSSDSLVLQRYVGEPFYFGFEPAINGVGAVSDSAISSVANKNYGMSSKGFFVTDGISFDYLDDPQINTYVQELYDPGQSRNVISLHDEQNETVKWWFPGEDNAIHGVGYNYKKGSWTILDQPITAASEKQVFDTALIGTAAGFGFLTGVNAGGEPEQSDLRTFPFDAGAREQYKLWDMYRADIEGSGLEIRFGFSEYPQDEPEWTDWEPVARENYINRESVFLTIDLRSTALNVDWALTGFSVHGERTGFL
jgi:hypothetical protein